MSEYTEISDSVDTSNANVSHQEDANPSDNYASSSAYNNNNGEEDIFASDPIPQGNATTTSTANDFDDSLTVGFIPKILTFVGAGVTICGLIIALAGVAAIPIYPEWLPILGAIAPIFMMMLITFNRVSHALWFDTAVIVLSMVAAFYSFFLFIALVKSGHGANDYNAAGSGNFFIFLGETTVCVAAFLAQFGF